MNWVTSHRFDRRALPLADRHYSRRKPGSRQFVAPARCMVLITPALDALWVTTWPFPRYVRHAWPGAWICSLFRNESTLLSSVLIREAISVTRFELGTAPENGMVTFIDPTKVRHKRDPGRCFRRAGFQPVGLTKRGLIVLQLLPHEMPEARAAADTLFALSEAPAA